MQAVLVMIRSDGERRSFSIARDMTVIGRREDCDLRIPLGDISRKHCRLVRDGDVLRLEDLGSSNGTYHNGERIQDSVLSAGDTIQIGPVVFALQIDGVPADEDLHPVAAQEIAGVDADQQADVTEAVYEPDAEYAGTEAAAEDDYVPGEGVPTGEAGAEDLFAGEEEVLGAESEPVELELDSAEESEHSKPPREVERGEEGEFGLLEPGEEPQDELHLENFEIDHDAQQPNG